jgi:hypothetical protein
MGKNVIISTLPNISQNYLPKVNTSNIFANSLVYDDGSSVLINTTTASAFRLDVNGTGRFQGALTGTSATFNVGSATTVLGLTGNGNGATIASITNTDTGTAGRSSFQVTSDSATAHYFASSSTNVSTATGGRASTAGIFTASGDTAGGLAFLARNAAGVITFHTGGNTERVRIAADGAATFSSSVTAGGAVYAGATSRFAFGTSGAERGGIVLDASYNWTINTNGVAGAMYIASATGNVGIGTTNPDQALGVYRANGTACYTAMASGTVDMLVGVDSAGLPRLFTSGANAMTFWTNATERMRITSGGNVGIGLNAGTSASTRLHIKRGDSAGMQEILRLDTGNDANNDGSYINWTTGDGGTQVARIGGQRAGTDIGNILFETGNGSNGYTERMRITSGGNLLVGVTDNAAGYRINAAVNGGSAYIGVSNQAGSAGDRYLRIGFGTGATVASIQGTRVNVADDVNLALQPDGGNVGIGTADPRLKLTVNGAIGNGLSAYPHNGKLVKAGTTSVTFTITLAYASNWNPAYATIRVAGSRTGLEEQYAAMYFLRLTYYAGSVSPVVYNVSGDTGNATVSVSASAPSNSVITITITDGGGSTNYLIADLDASFNTGILSIT